MRFGSLCTGIGGVDLGLARLGWDVAWQSEVAPHACKVLERRFPNIPNIGDLRGANPPAVDAIVGGIPCQPWSCAGKGAGMDDERDLWPAVREMLERMTPRPLMVVIENVPGLLASVEGFGRLVSELHSLGYSTEWDACPALATGAPHRRDRLWIVARRDGRMTWDVDEVRGLFSGMTPQSWPRAGRWNGLLHERNPRWPVPEVEAAWHRRWEGMPWPTPNVSDIFGADVRHQFDKDARGEGGMAKLRNYVKLAPCPTPDAALQGTNRSPSDGAALRPCIRDAVKWSPWPTCRSGEAKQGDSFPGKRLESGSQDRMLGDAVRMEPWTSAAVSDARSSGRATTSTGVMHPGLSLGDQARMWPRATASARDWKSGQASAETTEGNARPLNEQVKTVRLPDGTVVAILPGALHPAWVESLMNFPRGWTDLECESPEPFPDWPMPRAEVNGVQLWGASPQHPWEPPRRVEGRDRQRRHRLQELGNAVVPAQAELALSAVRVTEGGR